MHTQRWTLWTLAAFFMTAVIGCGSGGGGGSSDPANLDGDAAPVSISFRALNNPTAALSVTDGTGATADITSASVEIERIDIKLPDGLTCSTLEVPLPSFAVCDNHDDDAFDDSPETNPSDDSPDDDDKIKLIGPFTVDLLTGTSTPSLADLTLPSGMVREIRVRMTRLSVAGTVGGAPFAIDTEVDEDVEYEDLTGFEISEGVSVNEIVLSFDVAQWLEGVDLAECSADCSEFDDVIEDNVEGSGTFSEDDHGDDDHDSSDDDEDGGETDDSGRDGPGDSDDSDEDAGSDL